MEARDGWLLAILCTALMTGQASGQAAAAPMDATLSRAVERFDTRLTRVAADAVDARNLQGDGRVDLVVDGDMAVVTGSFSGLISPATRMRIFEGAGIGVPGKPVFNLQIEALQAGKITGRITLNPAQLQALRASRFYVQLDSAKAPEGTLWGWLMPAHAFPGQHVPERQPWFAGGL